MAVTPHSTDGVLAGPSGKQAPGLDTAVSAPRLAFIDGLRGIAALVVAMGHIIGMVPPDHPTTTFVRATLGEKLIWPWLFGGPMVWLFILVSGFALTWSEESRIASGRGRSSLRVFARRRAWRILPTYYVSLLLGLLVVLGFGRILVRPSPSLDTFEPVTLAGVLSHLGLVHNLDPNWVHQINPPLWSIAVEAQLYLLFPVLAWAMFRWRPYLPVLVLLVATKIANHVSPVQLFGLITWFVAGSVLAYVLRRHHASRPWLLATAGLAGILGLYRGPAQATTQTGQPIWLIAFVALVAALAGARPGRLNVATWKRTVLLGRSSYSLYAVHFPIAVLVWAVVGRLELPHAASVLLMIAVAAPTSLAAATVSYRFVEGPSLGRVQAVGSRPPTAGQGAATLPRPTDGCVAIAGTRRR